MQTHFSFPPFCCKPWHFSLVTVFVLAVLPSNLSAEEKIDFNRDIRPILSDRCFTCHGPDSHERKADLRFDLVGADSAFPSVTPKNLEESNLWNRIISTDPDEVMPPPSSKKPPLTEEQKAKFKQWILEGASFSMHWAFVPPQKQIAPKAGAEDWNKNRIDPFVLAKLERLGKKPKTVADKRTLIRRLSFDLTGLPPTLEEIQAFLSDDSADSYEKLVDQLMERATFGEHFAKYWLDLVRFADTNGIHHDHFREITPYRDWVIRSFNENLRFDDFLKYQLAGDLYENPTEDQKIASGFNRLHLVIDRGTALPEESFHRNVVDRVTAFGTAYLGMTVQCAACHDHKYDPITQKDFYQLYAFFNNIDAPPETPGRGVHAPFLRVMPDEAKTKLAKLVAEFSTRQKELARLRRLLSKAEAVKAESEEEIAAKTGQLKELESKIALADKAQKQADQKRKSFENQFPTTLIMKERSDVRPTHIRVRGQYDQKGELVERNTPTFLPPLKAKGKIKTRMDLANWSTDPKHPLTARVTVNRLWQQLFGVGLVKTSEDFGAQGEVPSHPELLDDLVNQFVQSQWNLKSLVKSIVTSETYRQSATATEAEYKSDPANRLLARGSRYRLDAEMIRDQVLFVSGLLNREMYGKSVKPPQPPNLWKSVSMRSSSTYAFKADSGDKILRRSLYSFWKRAMPPPQMTIFDAPTRESCIARRERTNTPLQALVLMNETQYFQATKHFARKVVAKSNLDEKQKIEFIYETLTSKIPDAGEIELLTAGLKSLRESYESDPKLASNFADGQKDPKQVVEIAAYTMLINSLFNLDISKTRE